jgi:hypothetical protein
MVADEDMAIRCLMENVEGDKQGLPTIFPESFWD